MAYGIKTQLDMESVRKTRQEFEKHIKDMQELANKNVIKYKIDNVNSQLNETRRGFQNINNETRSFTENMGYAIKRVAQFAAGISIVYGAVRELKSGLQEIAEINRANVNIAMITGDSLENVKKGNKGLLDLAENLKVVNSEVMNGNESWLRSGVSQKEANKNLETTTKLSKIAGVENKAMADSLIVIKNAYDLNSQSLEGYASKVALLDNASATSSSKINSAMQYSAQTFKSMGVDMDTALSWITNYSEKSAMSGEAIGRGFRSMLINFHKMQKGFKEGNEEDITAVNKLETLLNSKGIALRKSKDEWVDLSTVVKNIQKNIDKFSQVELSSLAFKIGGKEQAEMTLSTLNNMKRIDELNQKLKADSGAKALNNSYEKYKQGLDAAKANLKNASTSFWMNVIDEKKIEGAVGGLTSLIKTLEMLATTEKSSGIALAGLSASFLLLVKNANSVRNAFVKMGAMMELFTVLQRGVGTTAALSTAFGALGATVRASLMAFITNPIVLFGSAIAGATALIINHVQHQKELKEQTDSLKTSYNDLTEAMKSNDIASMKSNSENLGKSQTNLQNLLKQKADLEKEINEIKSNNGGRIKADDPLNEQLKKVDSLLEEQKKVLNDAGVQFDETTGKINALSQAETILANNKIVDSIKQKAQAELDNKQQIIELYNEYAKLSNIENKSAEEKKKMSDISIQLKDQVEGLTIVTDEQGNTTIKNTDLIGKEVQMLNTEGATVEQLINVKLTASKNDAQIQVGITKMTYNEVMKRISFYEAEMKALNALSDSAGASMDSLIAKEKNGTITPQEQIELNNMGRWAVAEGVRASSNLIDLNSIKAQVDAIYNSASKTADGLNNNYTPSLEGANKATKENANATAQAKDAMRDFDNELKNVNNTIYAYESALQGLNEDSQSYRDGLQNEINLLKTKNDMLDKGISLAKQNVDSLNSRVGTSSTSSSNLFTKAESYLGTPYVWGGESPNGFDCSGLVQYVANQAGISIGRTTYEQIKDGTAVSRDQLQPGDLVFFGDPTAPHHVGIYGGDGRYIHAPKTGDVVKISDLNSRGDFAGARRIISGDSVVNSKNSSLASEADNIQGKLETYEKEKIDNNKKIVDLYKAIFDSKVKEFDNKINIKDTKISQDRINADLFSSGSTEQTKYYTEQSKLINEKYGELTRKSEYIKAEMQKNVYTKKTLAEMQKTLEEIETTKLSVIKDLHNSFAQMWDAEYQEGIKPIDDSLDVLQNKYEILDSTEKTNYKDKIALNEQIIQQEDLRKQKIQDAIEKTKQLISIEKYDSTRNMLIKRLEDYNKELDLAIEKEIKLKQLEIELAKNEAFKLAEKAIYKNKTQQEFEDDISRRVNVLDDELELMRKKNEQLEESETRQRNLLNIAEAQMKLQDEMNNKNVQQLTKDSSGNWNFTYTSNQQNVDNLEKEMRDKLKSNSDFERETALKHKEEAINIEKRSLQDQISIRQEAYQRIRNNLETAINENSQAIKNGTITIGSIVTSSIGDIRKKYNNKYSFILDDAQIYINKYSDILSTLNTKLVSAFSSISSLSNIVAPVSVPSSSSPRVISDEYGTGSNIGFKDGKMYRYAGGTTSAAGGLSLVGEEGMELRVLNQGDGIIPANITKNLMKLGKNPLAYLKDLKISNIISPKINLPDINNIIKNNQQPQEITQNFNIDKLDFPNATNGEDIIRSLNNLPSQAIQHATRYDRT